MTMFAFGYDVVCISSSID